MAYAARWHGKTRGAIGACPPTGGFSLSRLSIGIWNIPILREFFCINAKEKAKSKR
jgi:hypothetical protein